MMRKRTISTLFTHALYLFLALLPFILCIFFAFTSEVKSDIILNDVTYSLGQSEYYFAYFVNVLGTNPVSDCFMTLGFYLGFDSIGAMAICCYVGYLFIIKSFDLVFDLLTFIPNLAHKYIHME